jgi:ABC-2 type transport system permease protein
MSASLALARREIVRFLRQRSRVVGAVAPPLVMWILVGAGFKGSFREDSFGYFFPGTVVLVVLFAAIFATISVIEDRREGFLQGVLVSPVAPSSVALGKVLGGAALGLIQGLPLLVLVRVAGLKADVAGLLTAVALLVVLSFALTALGFAIAWCLESTQGFHAIMNLFLIPMWLLSGAFFPVDGAPPWLRAAMAVNPLTYGVAALRRALGGAAPAFTSPALSFAVTIAFAALTFGAAVAVVARFPAGPAGRPARPHAPEDH